MHPKLTMHTYEIEKEQECGGDRTTQHDDGDCSSSNYCSPIAAAACTKHVFTASN